MPQPQSLSVEEAPAVEIICDMRSRFLTSIWLSSSLQRYLTTTNSRSQVSCADAASTSNPIWWRDAAICWNPVVCRLSILWYLTLFCGYLGKQMKNLTGCGLVTPYGDIDLGQHWLDGTKPLPEPVLTSLVRFCSITLRAIYILIIMSLKIILLKLPPHLPGASEWRKTTINELGNNLLNTEWFT